MGGVRVRVRVSGGGLRPASTLVCFDPILSEGTTALAAAHLVRVGVGGLG